MHDYLVVEDLRFVLICEELLAVALTFAGDDCAVFELFQATLDNNDEFLKPCDTFSEDGLVYFE